MDKCDISDLDKSQLHPFLGRAVKGTKRYFVTVQDNSKLRHSFSIWRKLQEWFWIDTINHPHALWAALVSQCWERRQNLETCCFDAWLCFYTASQEMCCWSFCFHSECQQHLFYFQSPHCYFPTHRMFPAQWRKVSVREMMPNTQQQAYYLKKPFNIDFQVLHFGLPTAVKPKY